MSQLDLISGEPVPAARSAEALTDRQQLALEHIGAHQPVSSDELGAVLHEDRMRRGGKGHDAGERCTYCSSEGRDVADVLRKRGLVVRKQTVGWCLTGFNPERPETSGYDPTKSEIPF